MNINSSELLLVDDIPTNLKVLFNYLKDLGFKVRIANNGKKALEQVTRTPPDLILLDVMMPEMDGFEVCQHLKKNSQTKDIPVIFMTAKTDTIDKVKGFEVGAIDYVTKPIQQEEVLARINTHLTIRKLQKTLEQKNQDLEAFAHSVAHDIKNPVNVICGFSALLLEDLATVVDEGTLELLKAVNDAGENITHITDALLSLASINHQQVTLHPINMDDIIQQVLIRLGKMIKDYKADIIHPTQWPNVIGHAPWIVQVWINYLSNGLKYGGNPPHLELGVTPLKNGFARFWIRDNGPGLTIEQQQRLFIPFTRLSQVKIEGHGLGLSIVYRIIEKCGGQVGVESQVGAGSTFYFSLPVVS